MVEALTGGREIARRIAMGESEDLDADWLVLLDWLMENPLEIHGLTLSPDQINHAIIAYIWMRAR